MSTILSTPHPTSTSGSRFAREMVRGPSGVLFARLVRNDGVARVFRSSNDGQTWTELSAGSAAFVDYATVTVGFPNDLWYGANYNPARYTVSQAMRVLVAPNKASSATPNHSGSIDVNGHVLGDSVAFDDPDGSGDSIAVYTSWNAGTLYLNTFRWNGSTLTHEQSLSLGSGSIGTVAFNHTGDGLTPAGGTRYVWVSWQNGAGSVYLRRLAWSGSGFSGGTATLLGTTATFNEGDYDPGERIPKVIFDGTRAIVTAPHRTAQTFQWWERDAADTTTTSRTPPTFAGITAGVSAPFSVAHDGGRATYLVTTRSSAGTPVLYQLKYDRDSGQFEAWETITIGTGGSSPAPYNVSFKRGPAGDRVEGYHRLTPSGPVEYVSTADLNTPPNAPALTFPTGGVTIDRAQGQRFTWDHSDPQGDAQAAYDLRYRLVGAGSWTHLSAVTSDEFRDFTGSTFPAGDYEWKVRTSDHDLTGTYSSTSFFTAANAPALPTVSVPAFDATVTGASLTVQWSGDNHDGYKVWTVGDSGGQPDLDNVFYKSKVQAKPAGTTGSHTTPFPVNSRTEWVLVSIRSQTLWSDWRAVRVNVSWTPPPSPASLVVTAASPSINVTWTTPAPSGGQPDVATVEVYRRPVGTGGDGVRWLNGPGDTTTWDDHTPAHNVDYEYRVQNVAADGTTSSSGWVA